ncbi:MAG: asparagine synthase (glutamine-hydrolyzing) [Patescibacteria group bacterium]
MCGITGVFHCDNSKITGENIVKIMRDALIHRGPDSAGIYVSSDKKIGLGHRRLAIIDLSEAANQPMANEDKTVWIVYNGEIYNFCELRPELEKKGHIFKSKSDTEVVIHAYEEYGFDCVKKFNGMFAFTLWDEKRKILFAARDHLGIKPFYYAVQNNTFYFGSEIKAILAHPNFKKDLDEQNISLYLTFASLPTPFTLFKDIKKLPAAHCLTIKPNGEITEKEYWNPIADAQNQKSPPVAMLQRTGKIKNQNGLEQYFINETKRLLKDSIKSQMVSDVPFGCFLSGGVDSSTNAALMTESLGKPVETFSVAAKEFNQYNEFEYSRKMAKLLNAKTHELLITENNLFDFLREYPYYADDPNGDQICFLIFYLSKLIKDNGVIVAQVGEGADEIFAGYPSYYLSTKLFHRFWKPLKKLPNSIKKILCQLVSFSKNPKLEFYQEYLRRLVNNEEPFWGNAIAFSELQKKRLLTKKFQETLSPNYSYEIIKKYYQEIDEINPSADFLKRLTYLEIKVRLPELLLARVDKMTMAHSVEARVPYLDYRLVELALNIPEKLKFKNNETKYILKKAVENIIPKEIIQRKKQGFAAPLAEWLKNSTTAEPFIKIIKNSKLRERNILDYEYIDEIVSAHQKGKVDNNFRIWNLITLSLWYDYWFK